MFVVVVLWSACQVGGPGDPSECPASAPYDGTADAFRDASSDWGLDALELGGVRLSAVDFDGDGWADLAVRRTDDAMWLLRNTGEGTFEDVTEASGILATRPGGDGLRGGTNWVWADVDNDGDLDVFTGLPQAQAGAEASELMLNQGDGTFAIGSPGGALRQPFQVYASVFTDVDRDGSVDLFLGAYARDGRPEQDQLFMGLGDGQFRDRTESWGLTTEPWATAALNEGRAHSNAWAVEACDLDGDGNPELLASSYGRAPNHLWHHNGADGFVNRSVESGYAFDHRTDWSDNESARCWCQLHPEAEDCDGVPPTRIPCTRDADAFRWNHSTDREPYRLGGNSGQTTCADLDGDGALDLVTSEIVHWDVGSSADPSEILVNEGTALRFARPGNDVTGLVREHDGDTWDDGDITNGVFDFDNDGRLDVYIGATDYPGTRGLLYHNEGELSFTEVPPRRGIRNNRSHGLVTADFDRDGDLDVVVGHSTARCGGADDCYDQIHPRLFENLGTSRSFVQLHLIGGEGTNRAAVGARVEVRADGRLQVQEVDGGGGQFGNQSDLVVHFGLGGSCEAEVTVRWPDAALTTDTFTVAAGRRYQVVQGQAPTVVEDPAPESPQ